MRMQHWSKWVWALMVTVASVASTHAQDFSVDTADGGGVYQDGDVNQTVWAEGGTANAGPEVNPAYFPGYSNEYGAYPVTPWPEVSPYDYSVDQTYYENGLWYRHQNRLQTRHYFGIDYYNAKLKRPKSGQPGGLVGSTIINEDNAYEWTVRELLGQPVSAPQKDFNQTFDTEQFGDDKARPSFRTQFGAIHADGSGWELAAFFAPSDSDEDQTVTFGPTGINRTPDFLASVGEGLVTATPTFVQGEVFPDLGSLPFDQGVIMTFDSKAWGSDLNYYTTPVSQTGGSSEFRASMGVRYLGIWEQFGFQGSDSGYQDNILFLPDGKAFQISPFTTSVQSKLLSQIIGPQLGLKWSVGGDTFRLTTEAKGSIAVNFQQNDLEYDNYGLQTNNGLIAADDPRFGFPNSDLRPGDPRKGREKDVTVDMAPVFEVAVMAELGIMQHVPLLNKLPGMGSSKFRVGYAYTQAWRIRRAAQAVDYRAPFPVLNDNNESWHVGGWTAGFNWVY